MLTALEIHHPGDQRSDQQLGGAHNAQEKGVIERFCRKLGFVDFGLVSVNPATGEHI